jgi:D-beta-D-heptose 7-phosphate kinase/D-beta-D-heptose 1-phosphate adenosyltransferase
VITRDRVRAVTDGMSLRRVVVVGDAMLDVYLVGDVHRISPEAPGPVVAISGRRRALGGAGNVAANAAAMGAVVTDCRRKAPGFSPGDTRRRVVAI